MKRISPEDGKEIIKFTGIIKKLSKLKIPASRPFKLYNLLDWIKILKYLPLLFLVNKYRKLTIEDYVNRFKSEKLKNFIKLILPQHSNFSLVSLLVPLNWMNLKSTGYPIGGSAAIAGMLENRYKDTGGNINFNSEVKRIICGNNRAAGIELYDGSKIYADIIISARQAVQLICADDKRKFNSL